MSNESSRSSTGAVTSLEGTMYSLCELMGYDLSKFVVTDFQALPKDGGYLIFHVRIRVPKKSGYGTTDVDGG